MHTYLNKSVGSLIGFIFILALASCGGNGSNGGSKSSAIPSSGVVLGVAVDTNGNVYMADTSNNQIRKIKPTGEMETLAGAWVPGSMNGIGSEARFNHPIGIALDNAGNVYVSDTYNNKIRMITPSGLVSTLAGSGTEGSSNGSSTEASFSKPTSIAVDKVGNVYVGEIGSHSIRKITPSGRVTTLLSSL